jgi:hypothetical protein
MPSCRIKSKAPAGLLCMLFLAGGNSHAQLSTYASATYGYQSNPLYNYERTGDQVRSTYLEVAYSAKMFQGKYAGGLTLFNGLTDRNYLDHSLLFSLSFHPVSPSAKDPLDATGSEDTAGVVEDNAPAQADSLGTFGGIGARLSARHDKTVFREYNNTSAGLGGFVRWGLENWHIRIAVDGSYRLYPFIKELSNASALLTAEVGLGRESGFSFGIRPLVGIKHFTTSAFDSVRFENVRTYVTLTKPGSGKGGARITVKESSGKEVLSNASILTVGHFTGSGFAGLGWNNGSLRAEFQYQLNLSASARILARTAENATINEDLYDDFFSYTGPEADLSLRQALPLSVQAIVSLKYQRKQFGAPAFDVEGTEVAGARVDRRTGMDLYVSRYFSLSSDFGLDVALSGGVLRNESNDAYNDFSGWSLGVSVGLGF